MNEERNKASTACAPTPPRTKQYGAILHATNEFAAQYRVLEPLVAALQTPNFWPEPVSVPRSPFGGTGHCVLAVHVCVHTRLAVSHVKPAPVLHCASEAQHMPKVPCPVTPLQPPTTRSWRTKLYWRAADNTSGPKMRRVSSSPGNALSHAMPFMVNVEVYTVSPSAVTADVRWSAVQSPSTTVAPK